MVLGLRRIGTKLNCEDVRGALQREPSRAAAAASLLTRRFTCLPIRISKAPAARLGSGASIGFRFIS
jgi:hypothetical protein